MALSAIRSKVSGWPARQRQEILFLLFTLTAQLIIWRRFLNNSLAFVGNGDRLSFDLPFYHFIGKWLKQGVIPFWDPYIGGGVNILASPLYTPFYPLQYLIFLAPQDYLVLAQNLYLFLHWVLGTVFMYLFARSYFISFPAIVVSCLIYTFNINSILNLGQGPLFVTMVYVPLALWCLHRANKDNSWKLSALFGMCYAMQLQGGFIQLLFYITILYGCFALSVMNRTNLVHKMIVLVVGGFLGAAMGSAKLIPMLTESLERPIVPFDVLAEMTVPDPEILFRFLSPVALGDRFSNFRFNGEFNYYEALPVFSSCVSIYLAFIGFFAAIRVKDRRIWIWVAMVGLSLATIFGWFPLRLFHIIWGNNWMLHGRIAILIPIALAILSGIAMENLKICFDNHSFLMRGIPIGLLVLAGLAMHQYDVGAYPLITYSIIALLLVGVLFSRVSASLRLEKPVMFQILLTIVCCVELLSCSERLVNPEIPAQELNIRNDFPVTIRRDQLDVDRNLQDQLRINGLIWGDDLPGRAFVEPDIVNYHNFFPHFYEIRSVNAYLNAFTTDFHQFIHARQPIYRVLNPEHFPSIAKQVFGLRYLIKDKHIYDMNVPAFPTTFFADIVDYGADDSIVLSRFYEYYTENSFVSSPRIALVSANDGNLVRDVVRRNRQGEPTVKLVTRTPNTIVFEVDARSKELLVVNEQYHKNWQAYVDGERTDMIRTNFIMRGIVVPAGKHAVVLDFEMSREKTILVLTVAGLVTCALLFFVGARQRSLV